MIPTQAVRALVGFIGVLALLFAPTRYPALVAFVVLGLGMAYSAVRARRPQELERWTTRRIPEGVVWLGLVLVALYAFRSLLTDGIPRGADHSVHLYHAWFLSERLWPATGRFTGWSQYQFAGYPAFVLYAPGPYMLMAGLARLGMSLETAYGVVLSGVWLGLPLAVYGFLRAHDRSRLESVIAALIVMFDPGGYNEGGWVQNIQQGVWTGSLSLVTALLTLTALRRLMVTGSWMYAAWVALAVGASLVIHPVALLILGPLALLYVLVMSRSLRSLLTSAVAGLVGVGLAAWWLYPMLQLREELIPHGQDWLSLAEVGHRMWRGTLFIDGSGLLVGAGIVGMLAGLKDRTRVYAFGVIAVGAFVMLAATDVWEALEVTDRKMYANVNFHRLVAPVRVAWWCFAAGAVASGLRRVPWSRWIEEPATTAMVALVLGLVFQPLALGLKAEVQAPSKRLGPARDLSYHHDLMDVLEHLRTLEPEGPIGRVMVREPRDVHCAQWVPVVADRPLAHPGGKPTFHFQRRFYHHHVRVLRAQGVEWILTCRAKPKVRGAKKLIERGDVVLWALPRPSDNPIRVVGEGTARLVEFGQERVVISVDEADGPVTVVVPVAAFGRWHATHEGDELRTGVSKLTDATVPFFLSATVLGPGQLEFVYRPDSSERMGLTASAAAAVVWLGFIGLGWRNRRRRQRT